MQAFSLEQRSLLSLLSFERKEGLVFDGVDWENLRKEAGVQTVSLAAFERLSAYRAHVPEDSYKSWLKNASRVTQQNYLVSYGQQSLVGWLKEAGISYVILKGAAAADYYPNPGHRTFGDVDFLVKKEDLARTEELLKGKGCELLFDETEHDCHAVFQKDGVRYEVHFEPAGVPYGQAGEHIRTYMADATSRAVKVDGQEDFLMPCPAQHGLVLLLHMQHHMLGEGLGLRHLCDWAHFVNKTKDLVFWQEELLPFLQSIGLYCYAQAMTKTCATYLSFDCPDWAKDVDDDLCQSIMLDVFQGGNFGQKDELRSKSGMLISQHGKNGTRDGMGKNLLSILHDSTMKHYPFVTKFPPVYPIFFVYRGIRHAVKMMFGKSESLAKMMPEAEKRRAIYRRLHVFEIEEKKEKRDE